MRIQIVGAPGSGKTTLAGRLSRQLGIPHFDLDPVAFPRVPLERRDERREELAAEILDRGDWIAEGIYSTGWVKPFFDAADAVIFLDLAARTCIRRILIRHVKASMRRANPYKGLRLLAHFTWSTRGWFTAPVGTRAELSGDGVTTRADTIRFLEAYASKLVVCRTPRDARRYSPDPRSS